MDALLVGLIRKELKRQNETLDLIPSENIADPELLSIVGSPLMNKYSEGYVDKRYYPGNRYYDAIEKGLGRKIGLTTVLERVDYAIEHDWTSPTPQERARLLRFFFKKFQVNMKK